MKRKPSTEATAAWIRLMRVQSRVLDAVEQDLKKAGYPPEYAAARNGANGSH